MRQKPDAIAPQQEKLPDPYRQADGSSARPKGLTPSFAAVFLNRAFPIGIVDYLAGRRPVKTGAFNHNFNALIAADINQTMPFRKKQQQSPPLPTSSAMAKSE